MASPTPEAAAAPAPAPSVESMSLDAAPSKDLKADLNGSPPSESKPETAPTTDEPLLNGDGNSDEHGANGVSKEEEPKANGDNAEPAEPTVAKPEDTPASPPVVKDTASDAPASPSKEEPKAESPKDVEMSEAQPAEEAAAAPTDTEKKPEPADATMTDTATSEPNPTPNDIAEQDVKVVPVSAPTEEKKDETAQATEPPTSTDDAALPTSEVDLGPASMSQLNIETAEGDTSPVEPTVQESVEVSMMDAPAAKVAREREDDAVEEPAPKRARTEPKESEEKEVPPQEAAASTPAASAPAPPPAADLPQPTEASLKHFEDFSHWNDPEFNARQIQPFQRRDLRKAMARVKKTKHGLNFRDAVVTLWPGLKEPYLAKVQHPMDLGSIDKALRDGKYNTFGEVKLALALMYDNCITFNGAEHDMAKSAHNAVSSAWDDIMAIPATEPVKPKPPPKIRGPREPRNIPVKAEAAEEGQTGSPSAEAAPKAAPPRRQSTLAEADRPKRTPRPTKPKEIEYGSGNSRKNLKPEMQFCDEILTDLTTKKNYNSAVWFLSPVDIEGLGIPQYRNIIKEPMDFGTIGKKLHDGEITTVKEFEKLMRLVFANAYTFNGKPIGDPSQNAVPYAAQSLEDQFNTMIKNKDKWLAKRRQAQAPPPSASAGSDEDEDEDDEDDGEPDADTQAREREVKALDSRYREETQKLTDLFAAEAPNQSMIDVQQAVLNMVQKALLDAKLKLNEAKQKSGSGGGGKAKKAKPAKKAAGGGGGRKSGGAAPAPKKATGGGGQKKKKNLSAADKDNIANAINDLEYPHLDKAIDIIKRDTGQMESDDGELELDIDQLSHEALLKLWEMCKRVLPGFGKDSSAAAAAPSSPEMPKSSGKKSQAAPKSKKNKPMSAQEQEARIAQLTELRAAYAKGEEPAEGAHAGQADVSMQQYDESTDASSEED